MTIKVQTPDFGVREFDADKWETGYSDGSLGLTKDDIDVAEFAKGAWLFVWEDKDLEPADPGEPRVWGSITEIPQGVTVRSQNDPGTWDEGYLFVYFKRMPEGIYNRWSGENRWFGPSAATDRLAPFTEVVGGIDG